jgi:hypothetical protein
LDGIDGPAPFEGFDGQDGAQSKLIVDPFGLHVAINSGATAWFLVAHAASDP